MIKQYMQFVSIQGGNIFWRVTLGENRNENRMVIHDNSMGETLLEIGDIWDTDLLKIVRTLEANAYNRADLETLIKLINRECRHLKIDVHKYGGSYLLIDSRDL